VAESINPLEEGKHYALSVESIREGEERKMIDQVIGYVAFTLIVASYTSLAVLNKMKLFYGLNGTAAVLFLIQAIIIKQPSLLLLHGFTGSILIFQLFRKNPRYICHRGDCKRRLEKN